MAAEEPKQIMALRLRKKVKERFPPYLGRLQCKFGILRGMLLGRAARLKELELPCFQVVNFLLEDLQELILEGYPISFLRALVHSFPVRQPEFVFLRRAVRACERETKAP